MSESLATWAAIGGVAWVVYFGAFGWWLAGKRRREPIEGAVLGVLGGPLGVIVAGLLPEGQPETATAPAADPPPLPRRAKRLMGEVAE